MQEEILFTDRSEFRKWLIDNHADSKGIWMIFGKGGAFTSIKPDEALEEALCYGWIDGQINSVDETKYKKKFTPRRKGSNWSDKNRNLACKLIDAGLMTENGMSVIDRAKKDGTWQPSKPEPITEDQVAILENALQGHDLALANFQKMSPSVKRTYAAHYMNAKGEDTRIRRLQQIVGRLNENKKPM